MERHAPLPWWFFVANWALVATALWLGVKLGERLASPAGVVAALPQAELEALAIVHRHRDFQLGTCHSCTWDSSNQRYCKSRGSTKVYEARK
jgi:hypothetical protein